MTQRVPTATFLSPRNKNRGIEDIYPTVCFVLYRVLVPEDSCHSECATNVQMSSAPPIRLCRVGTSVNIIQIHTGVSTVSRR